MCIRDSNEAEAVRAVAQSQLQAAVLVDAGLQIAGGAGGPPPKPRGARLVRRKVRDLELRLHVAAVRRGGHDK